MLFAERLDVFIDPFVKAYQECYGENESGLREESSDNRVNILQVYRLQSS